MEGRGSEVSEEEAIQQLRDFFAWFKAMPFGLKTVHTIVDKLLQIDPFFSQKIS